ncbi:unnamed protein product [Oppiella nova]|uniref:Uncharacterized protein n=1 Tax=Oppiella nova TaxID=334625 RepID=A0A7R9M885_9ACAR|nr:unnamed protein product [Oppiella nova]CAG2172596.1 unnamed protein product [Oppiella nova]
MTGVLVNNHSVPHLIHSGFYEFICVGLNTAPSKEFLKDCFKKSDVSAYTKVDLANDERKLMLIGYCDHKYRLSKLENKTEQEIYHTCLMNIFKK